jgi:hypothetical protein
MKQMIFLLVHGAGHIGHEGDLVVKHPVSPVLARVAHPGHLRVILNVRFKGPDNLVYELMGLKIDGHGILFDEHLLRRHTYQ